MAGKNISELTEKDFDSFIKKGISVIDFWAPWCGPCRMMGPIFEEASEELKGKVKFGKVNVDNNLGLAQKFEIMSIPTLIIFKDGKQVERTVGVMPKEEIIELTQKIK